MIAASRRWANERPWQVLARADSSSLVNTGTSFSATLGERSPIGLLEFEGHLLDRERPWAGTGGKTLIDLGYGFLGQYRRHVKDHINRLLDLNHHTCIADPVEPLLFATALLYGRHHKGMPRWRVIVERIGILLADPAHAEWGHDGQGVQARGDATGDGQGTRFLTIRAIDR